MKILTMKMGRYASYKSAYIYSVALQPVEISDIKCKKLRERLLKQYVN